MITREEAEQIARKYAQAHVHADYKQEAVLEMARLILDIQQRTAERCAEISDGLSNKYYKAYKAPGSPYRASSHVEGKSDGADDVSDAIRREFLAPAEKPAPTGDARDGGRDERA